MKKRTIAIAAAVAVLSAAVLIVSRTSVAYLMDTEAADNVIQIGQVQVSIDEGTFTDGSTIEVGRKIDKAPKLTNNGKNDEYVFFKVEVPKENVTLLYERNVEDNGNVTNKEGTPNGDKGYYEIFKILATGGTLVKENDPQFVFSYHQGVSTGENKTDGWIVINSSPTEVTVNSQKYSQYYFGYNKKLKVGNTTETLFDQVQLKSFIDGEVAPYKDTNNNDQNEKEETVKVTAYAIQADDLGISGVTGAENEYLDATALGKIWTVVNNKAMTTG